VINFAKQQHKHCAFDTENSLEIKITPLRELTMLPQDPSRPGGPSPSPRSAFSVCPPSRFFTAQRWQP